jgi:hypothetical protein
MNGCQMDARPHPGPLPQERGNRELRFAVVKACGGTTAREFAGTNAALETSAGEFAGNASAFTLFPGERAGVRAGVETNCFSRSPCAHRGRAR